LTQLGKQQFASASATLTELNKAVALERSKLAEAQAPIPSNVPVSNTAPGSGSSKQTVSTDAGQFVVDLVAGDLNSTRVQVETASESSCGDNCPVSSLADFVGKSGGYAGINGPYFCPASYPSCAGKTNSFDTLLMNKHKVFFNSDNNVYSTVPALVFSGSGARIMKSAEVGRDGGVDAVIASQPALVWGGEVAFGGDGDPKKGSRGNRSFIAVKDSTVYIGVVRSATVAETARVMKALGMQHALNLDSGGSTALMVNGKYLAGPGRQTPFGIVLVRK
jgi:exopolysaccharide biosynthesis protein